jgi:hypothetical protein
VPSPFCSTPFLADDETPYTLKYASLRIVNCVASGELCTPASLADQVESLVISFAELLGDTLPFSDDDKEDLVADKLDFSEPDFICTKQAACLLPILQHARDHPLADDEEFYKRCVRLLEDADDDEVDDDDDDEDMMS